jgi:DNA-binding MarR family transcriptional regulator/dihydrofolate reductase
MSRLINSTYFTLDGAIENPHLWPSGRHEDDGRAQEVQLQLLLDSDTVLMGRRTYEGFAPVWSAKSGDPYSDKINAMEKLVASTTLADPEWDNTTVISENLVEEVGRRKESGEDIVQFGFGPVSRALLDAGLLDELRLWVQIDRAGREPHLGMLAASLVYPLQEELFARVAECGHGQLRPCHDVILAYLDDTGVRITELARLAGQPKQYVGRLVDELEALGYVRRRPDPDDRRSKLIVLTKRGHDEQQQADSILAAIEARHATRIGADRYADFRRLLCDLVLPQQAATIAADTARRDQ